MIIDSYNRGFIQHIISVFKKQKLCAGFTVVEALVAIGILTIVISGGFATASLSLNRSIFTKEQITAIYLAQEGMEAVRWKRDTNGILGNNWMDGLTTGGSAPCANGNICYVDGTTMTFATCGVNWGSCPLIRQNGTTYLYNYSSGGNTIFRREIQITPLTSVPQIPNGNVVQVEVRVSWIHDGTTQDFVAKGLLYNWH